MVTLIDLLSSTYAPIQTMILPYLGVAEVMALTRTSKGFDCLLPVLKATAWNINYRLQAFFTDPLQFRSILGKSGGLITGTFPRRFLSRSCVPCDSIELCMNGGSDWGDLAECLSSEGYEKLDEDSWEYTKTDARGRTMLVNFLGSGRSAIASIFGNAITTADLNIITWNKVYSLYPYNTFIKKESFLLQELDEEVVGYLTDMAEEDLKSGTVSWNQRKVSYHTFSSCGYKDTDRMTRRRRIGDISSWTMDLDVEGVRTSGISDAVIESTTFRLIAPWKWHQNWEVSTYQLDYDEALRHPVLKYQYVTLAEDQRDMSGIILDDSQDRKRASHYARRCQELEERLDELTLLELTKIPSAKRPPEFARLSAGDYSIREASTTRGNFTLPTTWTFYDEEVIAFLAEAWAEQQILDERDQAKYRARYIEQAEKEQTDRLNDIWN